MANRMERHCGKNENETDNKEAKSSCRDTTKQETNLVFIILRPKLKEAHTKKGKKYKSVTKLRKN